MIRHYTKIGLYVVGLILAVVFVVRGIIVPIAHRVGGGESSNESIQAQAETEEVQTNSDAAVRQPLKGKSDTDKIATMTAGWHEDTNGKWYQNADGTYFANGFQDIDGVTYSFDENGYIQKGTIVRHLILPGHTKNSKEALKILHEIFGNGIYISIMNQYTPVREFGEFKELNRKVTKREYEKVLDTAVEMGIQNGFIQEGETASESFIPEFDYEGVEKNTP